MYSVGDKNKYYTLYGEIRADILRGKLKEGDRLPSKRALAAELGVSVITVQLAYDQLLAEGYIRSKERSGYFVEAVTDYSAAKPASRVLQKESADAPQAEKTDATQPQIDLTRGSAPVNLFPFSVWARLMRGVLADCGEHLLERVPCNGDKELRTAIASELYRNRGIDCDPENIVIGGGAEHLYGVIVQLLGRDNVFAVENPGYGRISSTYALNGAKWVPIPVKSRGMDINKLQNSSATVAHVSPAHQFPTGAVMPVSERTRMIEWAADGGKIIIEDDYDSEFRLTGKPLQSMFSLCPERVIYMNTFSKSLAPSMRMGYMVLPPRLAQKYKSVFKSSASIVPLFEQKTLAAMLDGGHFERHLSRLKNHYREVRRLLLAALANAEGCEVADTGSGLHVLARFSAAGGDENIKKEAERRGVKLKCLTDYLLSPISGMENYAVINYSGLTAEMLKKTDN